MNSNDSIRRAILAVLGTTTAAAAFGPRVMAADTTTATDSGALEEIVVTATRRSENLQDVPITIQAFSSETLSQLNVETFDDLVKDLPNVTDPGNGPGQGNIFMRGLSAGSAGSQSTGSIAPYPNVAIYLDDQSGQLPGRNLDIYAADLERVEILEGPQGTLFGAGAEAGVVRYITNKPKLDVVEGSITGSYGTTAGGDPNSSFNAVLNLPLITNTLAVRAVIYNDSRGGYINNVPGTFTRRDTDLGIGYAYYAASAGGACPDGGVNHGHCVPPGSPVINNYELAHNAINPVTYQGTRVSALWKIAEDWDLLLEQTFQNTEAQGVFYQMPYSSDGVALPPLSVTLFNNSYDKDKFSNSAWTVNGKLGPLKLVYTGGYLVRNIDQVQDYTNYARGAYADYYQCYGASAASPATCLSPSSTWREQERNTHLSNELRLSSPDDWRLRFIAGLFHENLKIYDRTTWDYKTRLNCTAALDAGCLADIAPAPGATVVQPGVRDDDTAFFEDITRGYTQTAEFASVDFDIVPKVLTITAGARHFDFNNSLLGTDVSSFGCAGRYLPAGCTRGAADIDARDAQNSTSGTRSRANIVWHITPDALLYYTWSQGFRPGAFNRAQGCHFKDAAAVPQWCIPSEYGSDALTNNEIGWKTEFLDHRLQVNGAIYQENWNNVQIEFFDPGQTGNLAFYTNGQNFQIRGAELTVVARVTRGLTVNAAMSWNQSKQTNSPDFIANNPNLLLKNAGGTLIDPNGPAEFGKPIAGLSNLYGPIGNPSPNSPDFQGNIHLRYEWSDSRFNYFAEAGATTTTSSFTQGSANPSIAVNGAVNTTLLRFQNPGYSTVDASVGLAKDNWSVKLFCENLTNENASVFTSTSQFAVAQEVTRPRTDGITISYKF